MEGILEGLLFVQGDHGLTLEEVMSILSLNEEEAKDLIYKLKQSYENENRGLRLQYLGNCFKLTTKEEHKEYFQKLLENPSTHVLSQAALEVLAIIAYNEPITRMQIDELRGVDSVFVLYKTTDDFLDYFGLSTKEDLPDISKIIVDDDGEEDLFKSSYREEQRCFLWIY